jgi:hypothetical protein
MAIKDAELTHLRAESLAIVYLTRHPDLLVDRYDRPDSGMDLLVTIAPEGRATGRLFGVKVKGISRSTNGYRADAIPYSAVSDHAIKKLTEVPFPVCLFVFEMYSDQGFWLWGREPRVAEDNRRDLVNGNPKELAPLTRETISSLVEYVNRWYDAGRMANFQTANGYA